MGLIWKSQAYLWEGFPLATMHSPYLEERQNDSKRRRAPKVCAMCHISVIGVSISLFNSFHDSIILLGNENASLAQPHFCCRHSDLMFLAFSIIWFLSATPKFLCAVFQDKDGVMEKKELEELIYTNSLCRSLWSPYDALDNILCWIQNILK